MIFHRFSGIKFSILSTFTFIGLLAIGLVWFSTETYQQLAFEIYDSSLKEKLKLKVSERSQALITKQKNLASMLQGDEEFTQSLETGNLTSTQIRLQQVLQQVSLEREKIHLKSILIRDSYAKLVTGAYQDQSASYNGCPVIIDRISVGSQELRRQAKIAMCTQGNDVLSEVVVAADLSDTTFYIHSVAYLNDELLSIDEALSQPINIMGGQKILLHQSADWQEKTSNNKFSNPVTYTLYGDDNVPGLVISSVYDLSILLYELEIKRSNILIIAVIVVFTGFFLVSIFLFYSFKSMGQVNKSLGKIVNDHFDPINESDFPSELHDFVSAYNRIILVLNDEMDKHLLAERDLRAERDFISKTLNSITNSVVVLNSKLVIKLVNPALEKILGESEENLIGYAFSDIIFLYNNYSVSRIADLKKLLKNPQQINKLFYQKGDEVKELEMIASPMIDQDLDDVGYVLVFKDVTEDRLLRRKLDFEARHNKLTGLLNRSAFESKFYEMINEAYQSKYQHVFVYINIDNFRMINQVCGNDAGDLLLKLAADILRQNVRKSDLLACFGVDEFCLILAYAELELAANTVSDILANICKTGFNWEGLEYPLTASASLISFGRSHEEFTEVFSHLRTGCTLAKQKGGNQYYLVGDNDVKVQQQLSSLSWIARINKGFVDKRFKLYVQPIVPTTSEEGKPFYEVLIRYQDEGGEIVLPNVFLGAADRFNLSEKIDRWVVSEVIHWMAANPEFKGKIQFSINLSGRSVSSNSFHRFLYQILKTELVDAHSFCFEITETSIVRDVDKSIDFIKQLNALGVKFSLDNIGKGLFSLAHLQQFSVDFLKVDGEFIKNVLEDEYSSVFINSIAELGHCLGMKVIAEQVETTAIKHKLSEVKLDYMQGAALGEPVPIETLANAPRVVE